jgi:hypothetical protein
MTVSAAKLEVNRRNALMSCAPRTESSKQRSKLNAVKHGMRAATLVLLDEDPEALEDRRADWAASLMPAAPPNSGSWMTPSNTRGCGTAPVELKKPGSPRILSTRESTRPTARPTKSCAWDKNSSRTSAARWPITRITIEKTTSSPRTCL